LKQDYFLLTGQSTKKLAVTQPVPSDCLVPALSEAGKIVYI
jgi:hypothetical protein